MNIKEKHIIAEVLSISGAGSDITKESYYEAILHASRGAYTIEQINVVDIVRDYQNAFCDYIDITFSMPLGDFVLEVYPDRDSLEMTLSNYVVGSVTVERLDLILLEIDPDIKSGKYSSTPQEELNRNYTTIRAQCLNQTIKKLRDKNVHGIFKDVAPMDVITELMTEELNTPVLPFGLSNGGLKTVPADNTRKYKHIIIAKGTKLLDVPKVLQKSDYGVYNGGISTYLQSYDNQETMYITPIYRQNLLSFFNKKLYIVGVIDSTISAIDSTYAIDGNLVKILVRRSNHLFEDDNKIRDMGTAYISSESDAMTSRPVEIKKQSMIIKEDSVTNRKAHKILQQGIGPTEYKGVSNNDYDNRSEALMRDGMVVQVDWKSSNARLLIPMMPVIYIVEVNDEIKRYEGILERVDVITSVPEKTENSKLTVFLKKTPGVTSTKTKIPIF